MDFNSRHRAALGATAIMAALSVPTAGSADWTKDILDERCTPEAADGVSSAVRDKIESSVRRAEASILPPTPVGDLSCLNDLMTAPIDVFSDVGGMLDSLQGGLSSPADLAGDLDIDVAGQVCGMAAEKWATLTEPLDGAGDTMASFTDTASNPLDRIASGDIANIPGFSGSSSSKDSDGYGGSMDDYVRPDVDVSEEADSKPIYPDYAEEEPYPEYDTAAMKQAEYAYNRKLMRELGEYVGCRVSSSLDGTKVTGSAGYGTFNLWDTPDAACSFNPGDGPIWVFESTSMAPDGNERGGSASFETFDSPERSFGQARPEPSAGASEEKAPGGGGEESPPKSDAENIWDSMVPDNG